MKKLRLNPEELAVEPFELEPAEGRANGTVHGNDATFRFCGTGLEDSCGYPATCGGTSCDSGYPVCYQCSGPNICDTGDPCSAGCN
ncbi:MAG TPA: hypothetical protein VGO40_05540 [Longimicrobium sp.]|jgi:hypothetical protein|nr:hypothetical protein [Longimicrobium sp.]